MKTKRWIAASVRTAICAAMLASAAAAHAQQAPPAQPRMINDKFYPKEATFYLPVHMDQRTRDTLKEVCLYVKSGAADWVRQEVAPPTIKSFPYTVPQDGEYSFKLVTIDKQGKATPADVSKEAPDLCVVVDRRPPVIDVQPCTNLTGDFCLRCTVQDANPDPQSLRVVHLASTGEKALEAVAGMPGVFRPIHGESLSTPVRVSASDLSGNKTTREVSIKDLVTSAMKKDPMPPVTTISGRQDLHSPIDPKISLPPVLPKDPGASPMTKDFAPPALPGTTVTAAKEMPLPVGPATITESNSSRINDSPKLPAVNAGQTQVLNSTRASIEYRIDQVGPSGVGKVEIYVTADKGATWQKIGEDHDRRSPAEVDLPGEGLFGVRLAVTNGNGFGGTPPQRGDQPTCFIEVDASSPFVQLRPIEPVAQNGMLDIRWSATDKNLGPEPISLYYRTRTDGAWQPIARHIKNDGAYRWSFPRDAGSEFYLRVEVVDLAGNMSRADTPNGITLDMTEPRAQVLGVSGVTPR